MQIRLAITSCEETDRGSNELPVGESTCNVVAAVRKRSDDRQGHDGLPTVGRPDLIEERDRFLEVVESVQDQNRDARVLRSGIGRAFRLRDEVLALFQGSDCHLPNYRANGSPNRSSVRIKNPQDVRRTDRSTLPPPAPGALIRCIRDETNIRSDAHS